MCDVWPGVRNLDNAAARYVRWRPVVHRKLRGQAVCAGKPSHAVDRVCAHVRLTQRQSFAHSAFLATPHSVCLGMWDTQHVVPCVCVCALHQDRAHVHAGVLRWPTSQSAHELHPSRGVHLVRYLPHRRRQLLLRNQRRAAGHGHDSWLRDRADAVRLSGAALDCVCVCVCVWLYGCVAVWLWLYVCVAVCVAV